eukprot:3213536-Alexandrium_andersonii.AAC.1
MAGEEYEGKLPCEMASRAIPRTDHPLRLHYHKMDPRGASSIFAGCSIKGRSRWDGCHYAR